MKPFFFAGAILMMVSSAFATLAEDVEALTGAPTKVVWEEHISGFGKDWDANTTEYSLMGFDTRGSGEITTIVPGPACVANPQITPDGSRVVYSDVQGTKKVWMVNWDGTGKTELADGLGLCLWKDPVTNKVWLYLSNYWITDQATYGVKRVRLDDLSNLEQVWSTSQHWEFDWRFRLSRDGLYGAAAILWPAIYFLDMQAGTKTPITEGCNQQIAPDNSYRMFNFESGNHTQIAMWGPKGAGPKKMINVTFAGTGDAWAPRFSNSKAEIMTVNSPMVVGDIYIAKFNADFTAITSKVRITTPNRRQKTSAFAWISEVPAIDLSSQDTLIPASQGTTPAAVRIAISNAVQTSTLPALSAASDQGWLTATTGGEGNSQYLELQVGDFSALASGLYQATVTVTGQDVRPVTCKVTLRVSGTPVATAVVISPSSPEVQPGLTLQFTAQVVDQFVEPMDLALALSVSGGGTISPAGLFTSNGTAGTFQVTATLASPALSATATLVVTDIPRANLALWLKADTGLTLNAAGGVTNWKDWSDSGRDAATTSTTFPQYVASSQNGMPAVNFNGDQKLTFPQIDMPKFTIFAVYRLEAITKEFHFWLSDTLQGLTAGGTYPSYTGWGACDLMLGAWRWKLAKKTPLDWGQVTITKGKMYRNGVEPSYQITDSLVWLTLSTLGSRPERDDHGFVGDIAEVIVYDRTLTAAEQAKVEAYLQTRYNIAATTPVRKAPALIARGAPVLQGLQLQLPGSGVYAIDIFTPRGARAGSFQFKAPGAFDLSHAGLSNGVYQIRVRAGADIFWLKAPVVR